MALHVHNEYNMILNLVFVVLFMIASIILYEVKQLSIEIMILKEQIQQFVELDIMDGEGLLPVS